MAGNVEQAVNHGPTASEYIVHHLQHMQYNFNLEAVKQTKSWISACSMQTP